MISTVFPDDDPVRIFRQLGSKLVPRHKASNFVICSATVLADGSPYVASGGQESTFSSLVELNLGSSELEFAEHANQIEQV
jgi:hypothetical protein